MAWSLSQIATHIEGEVKGETSFEVDSFATLQSATANQISFLSNKKYKKYLASSNAGAIIVSTKLASEVPCNAIVVNNPYVAYAKAVALLNPSREYQSTIDPTASIDIDSTIHPSVHIGSQVVIESGVEIEQSVVIGAGSVLKKGVKVRQNTRLSANITLCENVQIGKRCIIHPGVVIGADGFGIANDNGKWIKIPQIGSVIIGDDVEIGANTTIDRGAIENTIIGNGVKLDNQIQIAHNVSIGENTVIAGCVGIAGSTQVGKNCILGGRAAITGHIVIADGVQLTGNTMVTKSITQAGSYSSGMPVEPTKQWHRNIVRYRQMDKLTERVKQLENALKDK